MADEVVWMLDLDRHDWPVRAHQIVTVENPGPDEVRITACGRRVTRFTHPRGWWSSPPGKMPLAEPAIHCRASAEVGRHADPGGGALTIGQMLSDRSHRSQ